MKAFLDESGPGVEVPRVQIGPSGGTKTYISWDRLETILLRVGDLRDDEQIMGVTVTEEGINISIGKTS